MREIVLDTETTGFDPLTGDRLVEIGCIELMNHIPTGKNFHRYLNPEREMPEAAFRIHGLSTEFLADKPKFPEVAEDFLVFLDAAPLVIHNAEFDMKFINFELEKAGRRALPMQRAVDTVTMARRKFPGAPASLDALCKRFNIDNSNRTLHGALLDAQLLADVYLELLGGRQTGLTLGAEETASGDMDFARRAGPKGDRPARPPRPHAPTAEELAAHAAFVAKLKDPLWLQ
ncbi:DNA polymerase-3 subunit epsilon [Dongia mobilis]|uniref:DNA polymerase III subunit epsilon n=1 Tax=Dongia mobilis TaxID=578943 RepID=A0A4R6WMU4_9PROT|nr:DNA polymerase III subunit epsilon [Dongia mobilis]TDQ82349.1 DNA polymerase-3 subunit epsilon [Dongia mobilis]